VTGSAVTYSAADEASLSLPSRADRGGYVVAAFRGDLGIVSAHALREQLLSLLRGASDLIIDLSAVEDADASGLAVLVGSGHRARLLGGSLRLAAPSPEVARVLSAAGVDRHLGIFPAVRAAILGRPELPDAVFPTAAVPARGHRIDDVIAGGAAGKTSVASRPPGEGARRCSRGLPTGRGGLWSWLRKRPGCSTTATSAPSTSCSA